MVKSETDIEKSSIYNKLEKMIVQYGEEPFLYSDVFREKAILVGMSESQVNQILNSIDGLARKSEHKNPIRYSIRYHYRTMTQTYHKDDINNIDTKLDVSETSIKKKNVLKQRELLAVNAIRSKQNYTHLEDISPLLLYLLLRIEDPIFFFHKGLSFMNIIYGFCTLFTNGRIMWGGSTITQQLIKTMFFDVKKRSYIRKILEIPITLRFEKTFTKEEILELYLNCIEYGCGNYSIYDATKEYWNKHPKDLSFGESLMLCSEIANPSLFNPKEHYEQARKRQLRSAGFLHQNGLISDCDFNEIYDTGELKEDIKQIWFHIIFQYRFDEASKKRSMIPCLPLFLMNHHFHNNQK